MTERWVSSKKYWCEFCRLFVLETPIGRAKHEASEKHKTRIQSHLHSKLKEKIHADSLLAKNKLLVAHIEAKAAGKSTHIPQSIPDSKSYSNAPSFTPSSKQTNILVHPKSSKKTIKDEFLVTPTLIPTLQYKNDTPKLESSNHSQSVVGTSEWEPVHPSESVFEPIVKIEHNEKVKPDNQVYEEDLDPENLSMFKIVEKTSIIEDVGVVTFKKRRKK